MELLVLGGTAWLGREVARQAIGRGHAVTCLARGESGPVADGAIIVAADRREPEAYDRVRDRDWDAVIEVSWQPALFVVRSLRWVSVRSIGRMSPPAACMRHTPRSPRTRRRLWWINRPRRGGSRLPTSAHLVRGLRIAKAGPALEALAAKQEALAQELADVQAMAAENARDQRGPMLVPDSPNVPTQVVDVRDLAAWLLDTAQDRATGTYNAVGRGPVWCLGRAVTERRRPHRTCCELTRHGCSTGCR